MNEKGAKLQFFLELYKVLILTIIAVLLFISLFDVSIEKKDFGSLDNSIDIKANEKGIAIETNSKETLLLKAKENRDELSKQCSMIATEAQRYYRTPKDKGGGGLSFAGYQTNPDFYYSDNGNYTADLETSQKLLITAVGNVTGEDGVNPVKVIYIVNPVVIEQKNAN